MATWADVREIATRLPEVAEDGSAWRVAGKLFAWERPLRASDRAELGDAAPDGPILAVRVADEGVKSALVADEPAVYFTVSHFDGYAAVLIRLGPADVTQLRELIVEAWLLRAPKRVVKTFLDSGT